MLEQASQPTHMKSGAAQQRDMLWAHGYEAVARSCDLERNSNALSQTDLFHCCQVGLQEPINFLSKLLQAIDSAGIRAVGDHSTEPARPKVCMSNQLIATMVVVRCSLRCSL